MIYENLVGETIDIDKQKVICPWCHKAISKEDIVSDNVYHDGVSNPKTGEDWCELMHKDCAEKTEEWCRDKYGY